MPKRVPGLELSATEGKVPLSKQQPYENSVDKCVEYHPNTEYKGSWN